MKIIDFDIPATASPPTGAPPEGLVAFYWHFIRQTKGWYAAMFAASLAVALLDTVIPLFIGRLVSLMEATERQAALLAQLPLLLGMVALVLVVRPLAIFVDVSIRHNALIPGATSLIRWQSHWHVVRQSWPFFQNDFRRPHRESRHADGELVARERDVEHPCRLVHRRLWRDGVRAG